MEKRLVRLSKTISHALRHEPWVYELELDNEGWVLIEELISSLKAEKTEWQDLELADVKNVLVTSSKKRFEMDDGKVRALYGHSTPEKLLKERAKPPAILYHGTSQEIAAVILKEGIKAMQRHYVHLSVDIETAKQVGSRKSAKAVILVINAEDAYREGVCFYKGNEHVWLADFIPSRFVQ